jgi:ribosomal protein L40E
MDAEKSARKGLADAFPKHATLGRGAYWVLVVLLCSFASSARAQEKTLSGRWSASAMRVTWSVGDWGESCGPRPSGGGAGAGVVTISQSGSELTMTGAGGNYSTQRCWEQYPGLAVVNHSGGRRGWRTVCRTGAGDPRQATVTTTLNATDDAISFDEVGQYQFVVQGQNCTASVRRSRFFKLVQREGEAEVATPAPTPTPTAPSPPPAPSAEPRSTEARPAEPAPAPASRCREPGPPARLEVRPSRKLVRTGEEFRFRAVVLDEAGCSLEVRPAWRVERGPAGLSVDRAGVVKVASDGAEGSALVSASVAGQAARIVVEVASAARYDALLAEGGLNARGESDEASITFIASGSIGARAAEAEARDRRATFLIILGATAAVLALAGLLLAIRARRRRREELANRAGLAEGATGMVCSKCQARYPADATFCPIDGNRLQPGTERAAAVGGAAPAAAGAPAVGRRICPICGTQYPADATFCGRDGAHLVPIN